MGLLGELPDELVAAIFKFLAPEPFELSDTKYLDFVEHGNESSMDPIQWGDFLSSRSALLALTETARFTRRLAMPLLYQNVVFNNRLEGIRKFLYILATYPERGRWVHQITWLLPHPIHDEDYIMALEVDIQRHGLFPAAEVDLGRAPEEYQKGLWSLQKKPNWTWAATFPAGCFGAVGLTLLCLTPNLLTLNISGYQEWRARAEDEEVLDDPFFGFLDCRIYPGDTEMSRDIYELFSSFLFDLTRDKETGRLTGMTFPPPRLQTIVRSCERGLVGLDLPGPAFLTERLSLFSYERISAFLRLTGDMMCKQFLQTYQTGEWGDGPTFLAPSTILKSSPRLYLEICQYIDDVRSLHLEKDSDWNQQLEWLQGLAGNQYRHSVTSIGFGQNVALLDNMNLFSSRTPAKMSAHFDRGSSKLLPLVARHSMRCWMTDLLIRGRRLDGARNSVADLTLYHPHHQWVPVDVTGFGSEHTLGDCISARMPNLQVLDVDLRLYINNRNAVHDEFNPSDFAQVQELTITVEALWGPKITVMVMLAGDQGRDGHSPSQEKSEMSWRMRRKAVGRLPATLKTLRLVDWFAEYHTYSTTDHDGAIAEALELATDGIDDGNEEADEEDAGDPPNPYDPRAATPFYKYPPLVQNPDPAPVHGPDNYWQAVVTRGPRAFAEKYISALRWGLSRLCTVPPPHSSMPLVGRVCPRLSKIEFVYCLQSVEDPDDPERYRVDNQWREWCGERSDYRDFADELEQKSGIRLMVWEGSFGNPPLPQEGEFATGESCFDARMSGLCPLSLFGVAVYIG